MYILFLNRFLTSKVAQFKKKIKFHTSMIKLEERSGEIRKIWI